MKKLFLMMMLISIAIISCKKTQNPITPVTPSPCNEDKSFEGLYCGVSYTPTFGQSTSNLDTVQIVFTGMNSDCKSTYTLKKLNKTIDVSGCFGSSHPIEYHIIGTGSTDLLGGILVKDTDPSSPADIQIIYSCGGSYQNQLNFKKI